MPKSFVGPPPESGGYYVSGVLRGRRKFGIREDHLNFSLPGRHGSFDATHYKAWGGGMNARDGNSRWINYPCQWVAENYNPIRTNPGNAVPSYATLSTKLFANSRPDSKTFDALRAIGELKDLPGMLRQIRHSFLDKGIAYTVGHLNLSYKFGWASLFDDVVKTFRLQESIKKRFEQLKRQSETGSVLRKVELYSNTTTRSYKSDMDYWKMTVANQVKDRVWGYTIWKTTSNFPTTDAQLLDLAIKSAAGLGKGNIADYGQTAWNLIPWSWAADWFLNVGTYLEACRNTDDWVCTVGNICHETIHTATARSTGNRYSRSYGDVTPLHYEFVHRRRGPASPPTITAEFPILTDSQLGILGSIAATKGRG